MAAADAVALPVRDGDGDCEGGMTHARSVTAPSWPDDADTPATEKLSQAMPRLAFTQLLPPPPPLG